MTKQHPWTIHELLQVEVPEIFSAEQRCFRDLTFFSTDSESMKNISTYQLCFRADQLWFSLNQCRSELKNSALFQKESARKQRCSALNFWLWNLGFLALNCANLALISPNQLWYLHVRMRTINRNNVVRKLSKRVKCSTKCRSRYLKKNKISQFSAELKQTLKFSAKILKVHSTKRENASENLNHISFLTWVARKNPKKWVLVISLVHKKAEQEKLLYCSLLFSHLV